MSCYLCGSTQIAERKGSVRDDPSAKINECKDCGLVFLSDSKPVDYASGGMDAPALEIWLKDAAKDDIRRFKSIYPRIEGTTLLDFGCGAGGFLLRAIEVCHAVGVEVDSRLTEHFMRNDLDVRSSISEFDCKFDVITAFHVLEHMDDPRGTLQELKSYLNPGGIIILEVPSADDALLTVYDSEAFSKFTYWSCHKFLFTAKTLQMLAEQAGLGSGYIQHIQRYPLSNHLYWLAKEEPNGHEKWAFMDCPELDKAYEQVLASLGKTDTLIATLR